MPDPVAVLSQRQTITGATAMMAEKATIITVTFNSAHCLASLAKQLAAFPNVTLVDNGSEDNTAEQAKVKLPNALVIKNFKNVGFGAANNQALQQVTTPWALLLNPDCVAEFDTLIQLVEAVERFPEAAIIAPHLLRRDDSIEVGYRWPHSKWISRGQKAEAPCCVGFVCGAVMLLNMEVMREIGFFDENFFLYYEDEDLCQRVFNSKKEIILVPEIKIKHLSRSSVKGGILLRSEFIRGYHHAQSKLIFEHKHISAKSANSLRWKTLLLAILTLIPRLLIPQPKYLARLIGRIAGLCRPYPFATRPIK